MPLKGMGEEPTKQKNGMVMLSLSGGGGSQGGGVSTGTGDAAGGGGPFTFPINPEQFTIEQPARQSVTNTIGGAYQDHFGPGVPTIQIAGHTGWRRHKSSQDDGFQAFLKLRQIHEDYNRMCGEGDPDAVNLELTVSVPQGYGHYRVSSDRFRSLKSTQSPLLYRYEIQFTVLRILGSNSAGLGTPGTNGGNISQPFTANNIVQNNSSFANPLIGNSVMTDSLSPLTNSSYVVQDGDTWESISQAFYGTVQLNTKLKTFNGATDLTTGNIIRIPQVTI
jgi:nucleoid-associated protein YgaU